MNGQTNEHGQKHIPPPLSEVNKEDSDKTTGLFLEDGCIQPSCVQLGLISYGNKAPMRCY